MDFQAAGGEPSLAVSISEAVATIAIDRPARKNAVTQAMWLEIARIVPELAERDDVRVIVLTGRGADFSAGADIGEFETVRATPESARRYEAANSAAFSALRLCSVPTIASIRGICFGGGFGLAVSCDLRIATTGALFAVPAARLGLAYPVDAMADIVEALGAQRAKHLLFSASRLSAAEAHRAGFLLDAVDEADLDRRVTELGLAIAQNAPLTIRASKMAIRSVLTSDPATIAEAERLGAETFESLDYAEGRAAFAERRLPRFKGR